MQCANGLRLKGACGRAPCGVMRVGDRAPQGGDTVQMMRAADLQPCARRAPERFQKHIWRGTCVQLMIPHLWGLSER